ncbi:SDR family NAD(P)-dependent oxidoreductase [Luteolibacter sp. AS25]|uniref:SDR family NAD(P)-dependent oxidoreductase n=1 Tax=Luteolibacter sp. AS25 TaxID=3135776 RepID=UPI00398B8A77
MNSPIVLITGATRGIGFAAAKQLIDRGAQVIIGSRSMKRAESAAKKLGETAYPIRIDVTNHAVLKAAVKEIGERFGKLDVLVNNAAVLLDHYATFRELDTEVLTETLDTNLVGTFRTTISMLPLLEKSDALRIINVSSGAGQLDGDPQAWAPAYSISKTAVNMLTQQLVAALPEAMVNSMCPGWCRTEMGGEDATLSAEEGADTMVWLATEAPYEMRGQFVKERKSIAW